MNRRRFLGTSTLAASLGGTGCATSRPQGTTPAKASSLPASLGEGAPRRIIHVVSDGMSHGTLTCADHLSHVVRGRGLAWFELFNRPEARTGLMDVRSLDSIVTDSAASSSAWGCGSRVRNGTLNVDSKGRPLPPLMQLFGEAGWGRGLVTTTEITHATPAGFTVCVGSRASGTEIAEHYLTRRLDVLLGGARDHFDPSKRKDKRNLWSEFRWEGYQVLQNRDDLQAASTRQPWVGTFASGHLPYTLDRMADPKLQKEVPTLAEMVGRALDHLGNRDRFLLQVEGGRVDHGAHNADAASALREQIALDEALDLILAFQAEHPETLVVLTTDHGNANLGLNGMGSDYRDSTRLFRNLADIKASFPVILRKLKAAKSEREAREGLAELTGYKARESKIAQLLPFVNGKGSTLYDLMKSDVAALGQLLANHTGVGFTGTAHTSDYVPVLAIGPGADRFRGLIRNTDIFRHYTDLAGIDYRNPQEPLMAGGAAPDRPRGENIAEYAIA